MGFATAFPRGEGQEVPPKPALSWFLTPCLPQAGNVDGGRAEIFPSFPSLPKPIQSLPIPVPTREFQRLWNVWICPERRSQNERSLPEPPEPSDISHCAPGGKCWLLLCFAGFPWLFFFPPSPSQTPDGVLSSAGKLLRVSKWERWGRASARPERRLGLNPLYLGLTQGLKPHLWG